MPSQPCCNMGCSRQLTAWHQTSAMPQLLLHSKAMLLMQKRTAFIVHLLQRYVLCSLNFYDARVGHGSPQICLNLVELSRARCYCFQADFYSTGRPQVLRVIKRTTPMPSCMATNVPPAAIFTGSTKARTWLASTFR